MKILAGTMLLVALLAAACSDDDSAATTPTAVPSVTQTVVPSATAALTSTPAPSPPAPEPTSTTVVPTPVPSTAIILSHGTGDRRSIALTFDAGADPGHTGEILSTLRAEGIRASFGITGKWAEANPDLLRAIAADGHVLINHSYDHASFTGLSTERPPLTFDERSLELSRTETTIYRATNRSTLPYFRPPYGDLDPSVPRDVGALGYGVIVMWSIDSYGWKKIPAADIVDRVLSLAAPGAIVVMHVGIESEDAAALPTIIAGLRNRGYAFETVSEIMR